MLALALALDKAAEHGSIAPLDAPAPGSLQPGEIRQIRSRLVSLGYLDADSEKEGWGRRIQGASDAFAADAGIGTPADPRAVFAALEQLVSFDEPTRVDSWLADSRRAPALHRAEHLRLFSLGFARLGPRPRETGDDLARAREGFEHASRLLGIAAAGERERLTRLFDHDRWVDRFSAPILVHHRALAHESEKRADRAIVEDFVFAVAGIELWLHGYSASPRSLQPTGGQDPSKTVPRAMADFWSDQPAASRPKKTDLGTVDRKFFERVRSIAHEFEARELDARGSADEELAANIEQQLREDADLRGRVQDEAKSLGSRIWDGVRRAARWVWSLFRKIARGVREFARNIARVIHSGAARLWGVLRNSFRAVVEMGSFFARATAKGSDPLHLVIRHDGDFDVTLVHNRGAEPPRVLAISGALLLRARLSEVGLRILGHVASILRAVAQAVGSGWFALLFALYRGAKAIRQWKQDADSAGVLLEELDALTAA